VLGVRPGDKDPRGCLIREVIPDTAAEKMGLRPGDVITTIDEQPTAGIEQVREVMRGHQVGDRVRIQVLRDGATLDLEGELRARPQWRN